MGIKTHLFPKKSFHSSCWIFPDTRRTKIKVNKKKKKSYSGLWESPSSPWICTKKKKKMECIDLQVFRRVWSWYVVTNGRVEALRVWVLCVDAEWLLSSCAASEGDGRVGPACPCPVCASSWWFGCSVSVFVCVSVGVVVWLSASLLPPQSRPAESPSPRAAVRSPPDGRSRRSSSHHGWGRRERQRSLQVSCCITKLIRTETPQS